MVRDSDFTVLVGPNDSNRQLLELTASSDSFYIPETRGCIAYMLNTLETKEVIPEHEQSFTSLFRTWLMKLLQDKLPNGDIFEECVQDLLYRHLYGDGDIVVDNGMLYLEDLDGYRIRYNRWTTGQREFTPILLALRWILSTKNDIKHIAIDQPELGLYPKAFYAVIALLLDVMAHGYKITLATNSHNILDFVWAFKMFQKYNAPVADYTRLLPINEKLARVAAEKTYKVLYVEDLDSIHDLEILDPGSDDPIISSWGGLLSVADHVGEILADVVGQHEIKH